MATTVHRRREAQRVAGTVPAVAHAQQQYGAVVGPPPRAPATRDRPPYYSTPIGRPPAPPARDENEAPFLAFLREAGLERYFDLLKSEEINDVETLRLLTADDLKDAGLPYGPRIKLLALAKGQRA